MSEREEWLPDGTPEHIAEHIIRDTPRGSGDAYYIKLIAQAVQRERAKAESLTNERDKLQEALARCVCPTISGEWHIAIIEGVPLPWIGEALTDQAWLEARERADPEFARTRSTGMRIRSSTGITIVAREDEPR